MAIAQSTSASGGTNNEQLFQQLDNYPWDTDEEFQSGLLAILGPNPALEQAETLALRARCFYYGRKNGLSIDFPAYQAWHAQNSTSSSNLPNGGRDALSEQAPREQTSLTGEDTGEKPPYPMSFNHIVELITTGQPIPGIKDIPGTVLEGQASQATGSRRMKPWERLSEEHTG